MFTDFSSFEGKDVRAYLVMRNGQFSRLGMPSNPTKIYGRPSFHFKSSTIEKNQESMWSNTIFTLKSVITLQKRSKLFIILLYYSYIDWEVDRMRYSQKLSTHDNISLTNDHVFLISYCLPVDTGFPNTGIIYLLRTN
mgnify:CR=1 FL=1